MSLSRVALAPLLLLSISCTALLGVEDAVLDEGTGAGTAASSAVASSSSASAGVTSTATSSTSSGTPDASSASAGGGDGGSGDGGHGDGGDGDDGGNGMTSSGAGGLGGDGSGAMGGGGATSTGSTGGAGGASSSSGAGGDGGGGGGCALSAIPACDSLQPTTFTVATDLSDDWDVLAPQASVTVTDELQLRIANGTSEARIQGKTPLDAPTGCGAWLRFVTPSPGASVESGLAIETDAGSFRVFHVEGELRVRDPQDEGASTSYGLDTALVRARFDEVGDLWFDASPDGACWTALDGPFALDDGAADLQIYVERPGTTGTATSTFDDFSR